MNQIYCSNCGQNIPASSNFCKFCGAPQHGEDAGVYRTHAPVMETPEDARKAAAAKPLREVELYERQNLGSDALMYFFFSYLSKTIILLVLGIVGAALMPKLFIIGIVVYLVAIFVGAMFTYNNFTFEINQKGINIDNGVINKSEVSINFSEIENVNIQRTLMNRILGVAVVIIETAGNSSGYSGETNGSTDGGSKGIKSEAYLPGLRLDKAKKIHDLLIDGSDGVLGD